MSVSTSSTLVIFCLFHYIHPSGWWYLNVVFICIHLMTNDAEHLFMCLLVICISWRNVHWDPLHFLKLGYLSFSLLSCRSFFHVMDINLLTDIWFAYIPILWVIFSLSYNVLWGTQVFKFDEVQLKYFHFCHLCFLC